MEKKVYKKPEMKVMEFTVNENIAATTCNLEAQFAPGDCAFNAGIDVLFAESQTNCGTTADDTYCYYTVGANTLFGS